MSILSKNLKNVAVVYMVTRVNHEKIEENPPGLDFELEDDDLRKLLIDNAKRAAYKFDAYNDILQVSFFCGGMFMHFMTCDADRTITASDKSIITVSQDEFGMMRDITMFIQSIHQESAGTVLSPSVFAGWKINTEIWPMLVNRAFAYRMDLPYSLMSDPMRRFQSIDYLLDVSQIYSQGVYAGSRQVPSLADALCFWGYGDRSKYKTIITSDNNICVDPAQAAGIAETYLTDLWSVLCSYYIPKG